MGWGRKIIKRVSSLFRRSRRRRGYGWGGLLWIFRSGGTRGTFRFESDEVSVVGGGTFGFYVLRTLGSAGAVTVKVRSVDGTAIAGVDYTVIGPTTLTFSNGQTANVPVVVQVANPHVSKSFELEIYSAPGAAIDATYGTVEISIEPVPSTPGVASFSSYNYGQKESSTITIPVKRSGGSDGAVSIQFETLNGTAVAGVDYVSSSGGLNWDDGDVEDKLISVTLNAVGSDKYFFIRLYNPQGGIILASPYSINRATVTIYDVPPAAGYMGFALLGLQKEENTTLTVYVRRVGGKTGAVACNYITANDTAQSGVHYNLASGTLNWSDGDDADKSFTVQLLGVPSSGLRFTISLNTFTGGSAPWPGRDENSVIILNTGDPPVPPLLDDLVNEASEPCLFSEDSYGVDVMLFRQDTLVLPNNALASGVLGYNGGTDSFDHGLDLVNDDDSLLPSMALRHQVHEMTEGGAEEGS